MTPDRGIRAVAPIVTAVVTVVLLAACTTSPTAFTASTTSSVAGVPTPTMTPVADAPASAATSQGTPTSATASATTSAQGDPVSRWALARAGLKAAHTASYTVVGHVRFTDGVVAFTRRFTVDADEHTVRVRSKYRGRNGNRDLEVIVSPAGSFARDALSGPWRRATVEELADVGVSGSSKDVSGLPEPLQSFVVQSDVGLGELSGYVDVEEGLRAVGFGRLLATDKELASNIDGNLYTTVTLDSSHGLVKAVVDGADSTGWSDTTVYGGSKEMPEGTLVGIYSLLDVEVRMESVDEPVDVGMPTRAELTS